MIWPGPAGQPAPICVNAGRSTARLGGVTAAMRRSAAALAAAALATGLAAGLATGLAGCASPASGGRPGPGESRTAAAQASPSAPRAAPAPSAPDQARSAITLLPASAPRYLPP